MHLGDIFRVTVRKPLTQQTTVDTEYPLPKLPRTIAPMNPTPTKPHRWRPNTLFLLILGLLFSITALGQPAFLKEGLVAYYPFNGNANDESGNGYNGQLIAGTFVPNRFGYQGGTLELNGDNQYVSIPNFTAIDNAEQATFSCWVKSPNIGNKADTVGNPIFMRWLSGGSYAGAVGLIASETKGMVTTAVIGGFGTESPTAPMVSDQWQQMVIVFDGRKSNPSERLKYYVNGAGGVFKDYAAANPSRLGAVGTVTYIGRYAWAPISFKGKIDDIRIYSRALSDGEVKALYDYESASPIQSPVLVSQPVSKTVNSGDNVVLSVGLQAAGTYNYQWQLNEQNIAGATASSLAVNDAVAGVYRYRVIVSNSAGTVISDTATLTVSTPPAPSIVTQPTPKTVQEGANVNFNVVATGQGSLVYQWQFNEQNLPGATSATLNLNGVKLNTAGRYRVLVSSQYGVTISDTVTLTVNANPPPAIVTQPLSRTPAEGTQVILTITATGLGSLTYQWQVNGQNIPGATSSTLVLSAVRPSVNGNYRVIVGNPYGTTISTEATVAVVVTDSDSDGLSDYEELLLGTNSNKSDSDGDGLSDFAEVRTHGSNPLTTDTDGDGYSDGIEVARDGNPNNRSVTPTGALAVFPAVDVEFYTLNSVKYQLEVSTDMVQWTAQGGVVVGNGGSQNHLVRASKATQFWRLKVVQ
jgi:hypothetical protein